MLFWITSSPPAFALFQKKERQSLQWIFLFGWRRPASFLPAILFASLSVFWSIEILFPPIWTGDGWFSLSSFELWWLVFVLVLLFLSSGVLIVRSNSRSPVWGVAGFQCHRQSALVGFKFVFLSVFEARSTHISRLLLNTHHPAVFPVVFNPYCREFRQRGPLEIGAWSSRAREFLCFDCAWRPRSVVLSRPCRRLGSTASDLLLGAFGVGACSTRAAAPAKFWPFLHCRGPALGVFCRCVVYFFVSSIQSVFVLLRFYWNF